MKYSIFIEQLPFHGPSQRPFQRTVPINALTDAVALKEARDFVEILFEGVGDIKQLRAHVQRNDGSVLDQIVLTRDTPSR